MSIADVNGIKQYIQLTKKNVVGIAAKDGKILWQVPIEGSSPRGVSAVIPTPIFLENMVYVTNGYTVGCICIKLTKDGDKILAETVYKKNEIQNQHGGVVLMNGHLYGHSDSPSNSWVCQNLKTGEIVWSQKCQEAGVNKGSLIGVNDRIILLDMQNGNSTVIAASTDGWKSFGKLEIPERTKITTQDNQVWTHPVVANDKLYIRDHDLLFCFDLKM